MIIASIDKHPVLRKGLGIFLKKQFENATILESRCFESFQNLNPDSKPDLIIMGLEENSVFFDINIIKYVKETMPQTAFIIYDGEARYDMAVSCLVAGANGYLVKNEEVEQLVKCIETAVKGQRYVSGELIEILLNQCFEELSQKTPLASLNRGEYQVAKFLSQGMEVDQIAKLRNYKISTINKQKLNIFRKLNISHTLELRNIVFS